MELFSKHNYRPMYVDSTSHNDDDSQQMVASLLRKHVESLLMVSHA